MDSERPSVRPAVSVCIANYNGAGLIDECIESVRSQDFELPVEIIVHDDASTDGSAEHVRTHHPDVLLIESPENVGYCVANNRMAAEAGGDYLLLLNNDAALLPDGLTHLRRASEASTNPAILTLPQYEYDTGQLIDRGCLLDPFFNPVPNLDRSRAEVAMVIGACLWIPRALWKELGGFPEWFGSIAEDMYLCCRARLAGHAVRVLPESGYRHRVGWSFGGGKPDSAGRLQTTSNRRALSERNKTFAMIITYPALLLALILPVHLVLLSIEGLLLALLKRKFSIWQTIYGPLLPAIWHSGRTLSATRSATQRKRVISSASFMAPFRIMPRKLGMLLGHGLPKID